MKQAKFPSSLVGTVFNANTKVNFSNAFSNFHSDCSSTALRRRLTLTIQTYSSLPLTSLLYSSILLHYNANYVRSSQLYLHYLYLCLCWLLFARSLAYKALAMFASRTIRCSSYLAVQRMLSPVVARRRRRVEVRQLKAALRMPTLNARTLSWEKIHTTKNILEASARNCCTICLP